MTITHYETWESRPTIITQHNFEYIKEIIFSTWHGIAVPTENIVAVFKIKWK